MRRAVRLPKAVRLVALGAWLGVAGCGRSHHKVVLETNPASEELVGIWTGTFSDQLGDYVVALEIGAEELIPAGGAGEAFITWGAESMGLQIGWGTFIEVAPGHYTFEYDTYDPVDGSYRDTVSGDLFLTAIDLAEGSFATTSGTYGEFSLGLTSGFAQDYVAGTSVMWFADGETREAFYSGQVIFDAAGNVVPGEGSFLTDDLEGDIDPGANVWPIVDGYLTLLDPEIGYYEGELFFEDPQDTIALAGYLGWDLGVFSGIFEDIQGPGLFTFVPAPSP